LILSNLIQEFDIAKNLVHDCLCYRDTDRGENGVEFFSLEFYDD